jgi:hypothetical protein
MKLHGETGGDFHDRRAEANRLLEMIEGNEEKLTPKELGFVDDCRDPDRPITPGMLFWLRDINERLL